MRISNKKIVMFIVSVFLSCAYISVSIFAWFTSNSTVSTNNITGVVEINDTADGVLYHYDKTLKSFLPINDTLSIEMVPTQIEYYKMEITNINVNYKSYTFKFTSLSSKYKEGALVNSNYYDTDGEMLYPIEEVMNYYIVTFDNDGVASKSQVDLVNNVYSGTIDSNSIIIYFAIEFSGDESTFKTINGENDYSNCYQNQLFTINKLSVNFE